MATFVALTHDDVTKSEIEEIAVRLRAFGTHVDIRPARRGFLIITSGEPAAALKAELSECPQIVRLFDDRVRYPMAGRTARPEGTVVEVAGVRFGGGNPVVIAGPCSAERPEVLREAAASVAASGAAMLRVGMFKPRTSPYSFQGLGRAGLAHLAEVRAEFGLPIVSEVMALEDLELLADSVDMLQIGARNMQNYPLLMAAGRLGRPVLLKRGLSATVDEWLNAAEYLLAYGCADLVLCERGIRTFETSTRFTLDLSAVPVLKERSHLPVVVDPSHAAGDTRYVGPLATAALAVGADGVMVEVHPRPAEALSDGPQSLDLPAFAALGERLRRVAQAMGGDLATAPDLALARS